ncbi:MAG TPA: hypothetical protein VFV75_18410 [Candidatus Polarisedimenticolaceae bacterium]|nr:hypothetical protein [Candidatus Polarisedimenticolaceae bacterium]
MPELIFDRIEAALNALDASTATRIQAVDERLRALGVTVEASLAEPADVWNDVRLYLGYARIAGRFCLVVRRLRGEESTVEPLRGADRATRIAVVEKLPDLLEAMEAELRRRSTRLGSQEASTRIEVKAVAPAPAATQPQAPARAAAPPPALASAVKPAAATAPPAIALPGAGEVDAPLATPSGGNGGTVHAAAPAQESVDHMFRLFSRKGK